VIHLCNKNQKDTLFYSQFISIINLYVFRAGLLLIMRRYFSVYTEIGMSCVYVDWLLAVGSYCANVVVLRTYTVPNSCGHMLYRTDVDIYCTKDYPIREDEKIGKHFIWVLR
jgi:hypothetical protein